MGYVYILFGFVLVAYVNAGGGDLEQCMIIFDEEYMRAMCCESMNVIVPENLIECKDEKKSMCEKSNCVFENIGVKVENNKIDELSVKKAMDKLSQDNPETKDMAERTKKFCLDGQYEAYAPSDDTCDSMKLHICAYVNSMVACNKWKQDDTCKKAESAAKECKKAIDSLSK